jgi:hypothetical protein
MNKNHCTTEREMQRIQHEPIPCVPRRAVEWNDGTIRIELAEHTLLLSAEGNSWRLSETNGVGLLTAQTFTQPEEAYAELRARVDELAEEQESIIEARRASWRAMQFRIGVARFRRGEVLACCENEWQKDGWRNAFYEADGAPLHRYIHLNGPTRLDFDFDNDPYYADL